MGNIEKSWYELYPYISAGLGVFAVSSGNTLALLFGLLLLAVSGLVIYLRISYRRSAPRPPRPLGYRKVRVPVGRAR